MIFPWNTSRRRQKWLATPISRQWNDWLNQRFWFWHVLSDTQRSRLAGVLQIFVAEKNFEGCDGLQVNDEMKVIIAAAACMLLLGFADTYCFDSVRTVLVYPKPTMQRNLRQSSGVVNESQWLSGMAQQGGPIVLSWSDVRRDCRDPQSLNNVVIHEFAHHIDGLDGEIEGAPPLPSPELQQLWKTVAEAELERLRQSAVLGQSTILDPYGSQNAAEFFAVATEAFYCDGRNLHNYNRDLYDLLAILYRIDPKVWFHPET